MNNGDEIAFIKKLDVLRKNCYLIGYGIYLGRVKPTADEIGMIANRRNKKIAERISEACKFEVDDKILWQWDGWFMPKNRFIEVFINDCYNEGWRVKEKIK